MFLRRAGITPVVYEGQQEPNDEVGAFLNLAPNGVAVLDTLGIKEPVLGCVTPTTGIVLHNHRGRRLGALPETTTLLRRGLLSKALRGVTVEREIPIEFGKLLEGVEITAANATIACFEDGTEAEGDLLVGCNGRHSRTRRSAMPDTPEPRYTGIIDSSGSYRSASVPPSRGVMRITFGKEGFFGYQVAPSAEVYWFENSRQPVQPEREERQAIPDEQWRRKLLDVHPEDHAPIAEIIRFHDGPIGR
jgi:2-polyprenyl-6-methoxyphenol hydroxylase-like FAD-dependent oxidoreductase